MKKKLVASQRNGLIQQLYPSTCGKGKGAAQLKGYKPWSKNDSRLML